MPRKSPNEADLTFSASGAAPRRQAAAKTRTKRNPIVAEAPAQATMAAAAYEPSQEEIAKLAFHFWEARGCQGGSPEEDWLRAERELRANTATASA